MKDLARKIKDIQMIKNLITINSFMGKKYLNYKVDYRDFISIMDFFTTRNYDITIYNKPKHGYITMHIKL